MSSAIPLLPIYAFTARIGTTFEILTSTPTARHIGEAGDLCGRQRTLAGKTEFILKRICVLSSLNIPLKCVSLFLF